MYLGTGAATSKLDALGVASPALPLGQHARRLRGGVAFIGYYAFVLPFLQREAPRQFSSRLLIVLGLSLAATCLNPFGVKLWGYVIAETLNPLNKMYVQEWQPTQFVPMEWNSALFLVILAATLIVAILNRARQMGYLLLAAIFALLGFSAPRHIPLFAIVTIPLVAKWLEEIAHKQPADRNLNPLFAGWLGIALLPVLLTAYFTLQNPSPRIRVKDEHYHGFPYEAVEFLRRQPTAGNVWNELAWGGYLMWELGPRWKVSLDGRNLTVYPRQGVKDHFELHTADSPALAVLDRYPIDLCLLRPARAVVGRLRKSDDWEKVYEDKVAVIFRRRDSVLTNPIPQAEMPKLKRPEELFLQAD